MIVLMVKNIAAVFSKNKGWLRLDVKACSFAVTLPGRANRVGRSGLFFILAKVSLVPRALPLFDTSLVAEK